MRFGRVAEQRFNFSRTEVTRINGDNHITRFNTRRVMPGDGNHNALLFNARAFKAQFDAQLCCRHFYELTYGVLNAGRDNEIFWLFLLQHHPLHFT